MRPEWQRQAACRGGNNTDTFYPDNAIKGGQVERDRVSIKEVAAKALCRTCPVKDDCLMYAIRADEHDGIWGGLMPDERQEWIKMHGRS